MQERLDNDRAAFQKFVDTMRGNTSEDWNGRRAAQRLVILDQYRRRPIGWGRTDPTAWEKFQELQRIEGELRQKFSSYLDELLEREGPTESTRTKRLKEELRRFNSIPAQERDLRRARRVWGKKFIKDAKTVFDIGANNQIVDVAGSGGQSTFSLTHARNREYENGQPQDPAIFMGRIAARAQHFGAGNCGEQSAWVATEAYKWMPGTQITMVRDGKVDHMYAILGPPHFPESAYVDSWPKNASVADVSSYGLKHKPKNSAYFQGVADGRNLRAEGLKWLHPLPDRPSRKQPLKFEQAMEHVKPYAKSVYYITSTKDGYNSDSDAEDAPGPGLTLNEEAFTANAANGFRTPHSPGSSSFQPQHLRPSVPSSSHIPSRNVAAALLPPHPGHAISAPPVTLNPGAAFPSAHESLTASLRRTDEHHGKRWRELSLDVPVTDDPRRSDPTHSTRPREINPKPASNSQSLR
ncbi:hypothetical protein AB0F46_41880 [Streptomyces sp. NPDC026665]|uniref:hypothetical protein n=1 Tax=Streptomyces sp. NPDC026665 TaxID=3154798 RepID=UPI0033D5FC51